MKRIWKLYAAILMGVASSASAQETCTQEKALEVFRAYHPVAAYCSDAAKYQHHECSFDITRRSPSGEKDDPNILWYPIASAIPQLTLVGRVSAACQLIVKPPFYISSQEHGTIELGTLEATDVVIGKVVDVQSPQADLSNGGAKLQTESVTVAVSKVLKGEQVSKITFDNGFAWPKYSAKLLWLADGHERLFFISRGRLAGTKNQDCVAAVQAAGDDEDKQNKALADCRAANQEMRRIISGDWPNGIDLQTVETAPFRAIFSANGDVLKTRKDILAAVDKALLMQKDMSGEQMKAALLSKKKKYLNPEAYPDAYSLGVPKGNMVILDVPGQ